MKKEEFPYDFMPWKLIISENKEKRICYFDCEENMKKYIHRLKLKKKQYQTKYKYENK